MTESYRGYGHRGHRDYMIPTIYLHVQSVCDDISFGIQLTFSRQKEKNCRKQKNGKDVRCTVWPFTARDFAQEEAVEYDEKYVQQRSRDTINIIQ